MLPEHGKYYSPAYHVLPTAQMLEALDTGQNETWARLKAELLKDQGNKRVYLRGFPAQQCHLKNFDLSRCDLIDFKWPALPARAEDIASLKDSVLIANGPQEKVNRAYFMLHMGVKRTYERDNPRAQSGQPRPTPVLFGRQVSQTTMKNSPGFNRG